MIVFAADAERYLALADGFQKRDFDRLLHTLKSKCVEYTFARPAGVDWSHV